MNMLYTLTWHGSDAETEASAIYIQLRDAVARGSRFPLDCPYEIGLARARASTDEEWVIAVMVLGGAQQSDLGLSEITQQIDKWFIQSGAQEARGGAARVANHLKLSSELGIAYEVIASFGTFVGEPDPDSVGKPILPSDEEPVSAADIKNVAAAEPEITTAAMINEIARPLITPTTAAHESPAYKPPVQVLPEQAAAGRTNVSGCLGAGLTGAGILIGLSGVLLGLLLTVGTFVDNTSETILSDFLIMMACFPLPVIMLGLLLLGAGIFVLVWNRKKRLPKSA